MPRSRTGLHSIFREILNVNSHILIHYLLANYQPRLNTSQKRYSRFWGPRKYIWLAGNYRAFNPWSDRRWRKSRQNVDTSRRSVRPRFSTFFFFSRDWSRWDINFFLRPKSLFPGTRRPCECLNAIPLRRNTGPGPGGVSDSTDRAMSPPPHAFPTRLDV